MTAVRPLLRGIEMAPALLQARMASRVWAKGCHPDEFVLALPLLIPALVVCAFGEWVGCLAGPGNALHKVE